MEDSGIGELLARMIAIDTQNPGGSERKLAETIADELRNVPCRCWIQPVDGGRRANVFAHIEGWSEEGALVLNGHLDTVPNGGMWAENPQRACIQNGRMYGRGASDMKSGLAVLLAAFKRRAMENRIPRRGIWFVGTCDEEASGLGARAALNQIHGRVSALLIGEPTAGEIGLAAKGCIWLKLRGSGRTSHGAYPERGVDAIGHLTAVVDGIRAAYFSGEAAHPLLGRATCTLTQISGGIKANMVADRAEAMLDIRTLPCMAHGTLLNGIRKLCADYCAAHPGFAVEMEIENLRPPVETEPNYPLAACLRACIQETQSVPARETGTAFFSDASILRDLGVQDIILFGPGDPTLAHVPNEYVELEACEWALSIVNRVLDQFCG